MARGDDVAEPTFYREISYGVANAAVPAGAGTTVVKAGPGANGSGMLCRAVITAAGTTGNLTIYDSPTGATGNVIAVIPGTTANANALIGTVFDFRIPILNGIAAVGAANSPGVTISYL